MPHVTHTAEGWQVGADVYASLRDALDAALAGVATFEKPAYFRGTDGEEIGVWRWLPAGGEEPVAIKGVCIDAQAIEEMVASLNANRRAVSIDGGPPPPGMGESHVHGSMYDSGTLSNGRGHWGVSVLDERGHTLAFLWAELLPHIAREVDMGRLGEGSVGIGFDRLDGEHPRGVKWRSHALTNEPLVEGLAPANSVRAGESVAWRSHSLAGLALRTHRARGETMPLPIDEKKTDEKVPEKLDGKIEDAKKPDDAKRETDPDVLAAIDMATGAGVDVAAIVAAIVALTETPAEKPADEPAAEVEAARAAVGSLRSEVVALRAEVAELAPLRAEKIARDRTDAIDKAMTVRGVAPAQRSAFLAHAEKYGTESAIAAIELAHVPPVGSPIPTGAARSRATGAPEAALAAVADDKKLDAEAKKLIPGLRAQHPDEPGHLLMARAQKAVRAAS